MLLETAKWPWAQCSTQSIGSFTRLDEVTQLGINILTPNGGATAEVNERIKKDKTPG